MSKKAENVEGMRALAFQPKTMLAFIWAAPSHLPQVRGQLTDVLVRLREWEADWT